MAFLTTRVSLLLPKGHGHTNLLFLPLLQVFLSLFLLVLFLSPDFVSANSFQAARCVARSPRCYKKLAARSGNVCLPKVQPAEQPKACIDLACSYCRFQPSVRMKKAPCKRQALRVLCFPASAPVTPTPSNLPTVSLFEPSGPPEEHHTGPTDGKCATVPDPNDPMCFDASVTPTPTASETATTTTTTNPTSTPTKTIKAPTHSEKASTVIPTPTPTTSTPVPSTPAPAPSGPCLWTAVNGRTDVTIPFSALSSHDGWTPTSRSRHVGLIYRKDKDNGLEKAGAKGVICLTVRVPSTGKYYLSAYSFAPHRSEHNDIWLSASVPIQFWRLQKKGPLMKPGEWRKAYQNNGPKSFGTDLKTIDRNGHKFVTTLVREGSSMKVCVSGRSSKFEVFAVVVAKCGETGNERTCVGKSIAASDIERMVNTPSKCVRGSSGGGGEGDGGDDQKDSATPTPTTSVPPPTKTATPTPTPTPTPTKTVAQDPTTPTSGNGKCTTWLPNANGDLVVPLLPSMATDGWQPTSRAGFSGLVYQPGKSSGRDKPGQSGVMCMNVLLASPGKYYLTALSYAPHNTEHNDMWVRGSKGFELWQGGKTSKFGGRVSAVEWRKAYQNYGRRGIADDLKTIDNNGHRFVVPESNGNEVMEVCVSGRSYKFELFRVILVKCDESNSAVCKGSFWFAKDLEKRPLSTCI